MPQVASTQAHLRDELIARARAAQDVGDLFRAASASLRRLVPFAGAVWLAADPATGLPTAPTRVENLDHIGIDDCLRAWELEFTVEDVNLYGALARSGAPAAGLRQATSDRPARSARYRSLVRPGGYTDELRGVLRVDGSPWALLALYREDGEPAFDADESAFVAGLSEPLGAAVREHARPRRERAAEPGCPGPGLMLFAPSGELLSVNDDARALLDEISGAPAPSDAFAVPLPMVVIGTLMRARAIAQEHTRGSARARIRSRATGRWLVCHASCLRDQDGAVGETALVIEPASPSEIAPIVAQAYDLSLREQQITELIARGAGTAAIARRLSLSAHTVRDYVKTIFGKAGVSSRGELVAHLFAEHYAPMHLDQEGMERVRV